MAETSSGITEEEGQFNLSKQIADVAEVKFTDRGAGGDEPLQEPAGVSSDAASPAPVMPCVDVEMQFSTQPPVDVAPDSVCGIDMLAQPADYQIQPEQQQKEVAPECVPSAEIASDEIDELTKHAAAKKKKMSAGEPIYGSDGTVLTSGRLFTGGDAYSYGGPQGSSGLLKRDAMHTLGDVKDESGSSERPILNTKMSPMIFRVDHYSVMNLISRLRNSWAFNFLSDKLWESICPEGLDLTFYDAQGRAVKPRRWYANDVVNGKWVPQVKLMLRSMLAVGYAIVVYAPDPELDGEIVPTVIDPDEAILEWTVDQNGMRYYTPRPIGPLLAVNDRGPDGHHQFQACDVFFSSHPSHFGQPNSKALAAFPYLIMLEQLFMDYRVAAHARNNLPLVVQSREYGVGPRHPGSGDPRVAPFLGMSPAGEASAAAAATERTLALHNFVTSAMAASSAKTRQGMVRRTYEGAIASARLSAFEVGDADTGSVYEVSPDQMWQRALLPLPPGSEVAHMDPPGLPNEFTDLVKLIVAKTCAIFGVPSEVVLGAIGGAKVATATLAQEQFRAAVVSWRRLLAGTCATKCYWRINGAIGHAQKLADALALEGRQLTPEDVVKIVDDLAIELTFRPNKLDLETAVALNAQGFVTSEAVAKQLMRDYGLCQSDVMIPLSPAEQAILEYKQLVLQQKEEEILAEGEDATKNRGEKTAPRRKRPASGGGSDADSERTAPKRHGFERRRSAPPPDISLPKPSSSLSKKKKPFGDIGLTDVGSIGFAEKTRLPSRNAAPKV